uniref:DDE_Tnp_1_7 domain-containing protein n=1 Tax=Glossina austeni TaxID=7395 RepID=A0A1A9VPF5_GLOAU
MIDYLRLFNETMGRVYKPETKLCINEAIVLWRGKLIFRQYIKNKRHIYGIKLYELCEPNEIVLRVKIYAGKYDDLSRRNHTSNVVLGLMDGFLNSGYELYMDNYYNSVGLAIKKKLNQGDSEWLRSGSIMVKKRKDKRDVLTISNMHRREMVQVQNINGKISSNPDTVIGYILGMAGIDGSDQRFKVKQFGCINVRTNGLGWSCLQCTELDLNLCKLLKQTQEGFKNLATETWLKSYTKDDEILSDAAEHRTPEEISPDERDFQSSLFNLSWSTDRTVNPQKGFQKKNDFVKHQHSVNHIRKQTEKDVYCDECEIRVKKETWPYHLRINFHKENWNKWMDMSVTCVESTFQNRIETYKWENRNKENLIPEDFLTSIENNVIRTLRNTVQKHRNIKFNCILCSENEHEENTRMINERRRRPRCLEADVRRVIVQQDSPRRRGRRSAATMRIDVGECDYNPSYKNSSHTKRSEADRSLLEKVSERAKQDKY